MLSRPFRCALRSIRRGSEPSIAHCDRLKRTGFPAVFDLERRPRPGHIGISLNDVFVHLDAEARLVGDDQVAMVDG